MSPPAPIGFYPMFCDDYTMVTFTVLVKIYSTEYFYNANLR